MASPHISIITVTYNAADAIEVTIKSIVALKSDEMEFIIIDGASTDGTIDIIDNYKEYITYFKSEPDKGIYDAMNKAWEKANENNYILFLGAGDYVLNMPSAESFNSADIIAGSVQLGNKILYKPKVDIRLKLGNTLHHQALLIKKSLHIAPPFNLNYKTYADFDFNQRLIKSGQKVYIDSEFKGYALEGGLSAKFDKKQSLAVVKNNFGWFYMLLAKLYYSLRHEI